MTLTSADSGPDMKDTSGRKRFQKFGVVVVVVEEEQIRLVDSTDGAGKPVPDNKQDTTLLEPTYLVLVGSASAVDIAEHTVEETVAVVVLVGSRAFEDSDWVVGEIQGPSSAAGVPVDLVAVEEPPACHH